MKRAPIKLDYAGSDGTNDMRGFVTSTLMWVGLCTLVSLWWQVGIRYGQTVEGSRVLMKEATGTDIWDFYVIQLPLLVLSGGALGITLLQSLMASAKRWRQSQLLLIPFGFMLVIISVCVSYPRIDDASP